MICRALTRKIKIRERKLGPEREKMATWKKAVGVNKKKFRNKSKRRVAQLEEENRALKTRLDALLADLAMDLHRKTLWFELQALDRRIAHARAFQHIDKTIGDIKARRRLTPARAFVRWASATPRSPLPMVPLCGRELERALADDAVRRARAALKLLEDDDDDIIVFPPTVQQPRTSAEEDVCISTCRGPRSDGGWEEHKTEDTHTAAVVASSPTTATRLRPREVALLGQIGTPSRTDRGVALFTTRVPERLTKEAAFFKLIRMAQLVVARL